MYVDDITLAGKKQSIDPMWKLLNKEVDLGEPTSFLDHVYFVTQRQCEKRYCGQLQNHVRIANFSGEGLEKLPFPQNLRISSWSYDMEGHAKKCVERYCELANKTTQQIYKVSTPCIDDHHFKEEEMKSVGELSQVCSQIVQKCLHLARIGRPDVLWSVNKLARSITKWTKACYKRLNRLISYIHRTWEYKQYCYVGNTAKQCRLGLFQDSDFAGDLEDSKSTSGFASRSFVVCVFEDNEVVIKMIIKGRSPTTRHVSRTHRVALDWLFNRINLDPKIQIKYMDTKDQLADILSNGNFTRDEWNHLLCLFNISHFRSTGCSETMVKRSLHDSAEERVTAKSRPMMNLIARVPSNVSSSTSARPVKRSYGNQNPWSTIAEKEERSGRLDIGIDRKKASDHYYHEQG